MFSDIITVQLALCNETLSLKIQNYSTKSIEKSYTFEIMGGQFCSSAGISQSFLGTFPTPFGLECLNLDSSLGSPEELFCFVFLLFALLGFELRASRL
jgi:hypothetical protein